MKKSKSFAIGAFIVGAILLVFVALLFLSGGDFFSHKERVIMYFEGSVQGLQIGAPIKLKGVVLGEITDIQINFDNYDKKNVADDDADNNIITAVTGELALQKVSEKGAEVNRQFFENAIGKGLRAQLNFQSFLTGLLYVELDFFPESPAHLYGTENNHLELPTIKTGFQELTKVLQEINFKGLVDNLDQLTLRLTTIVQSGIIEQTLGSVKTAADNFSETSVSVGKNVNQLSQDLRASNTQVNRLFVNLNEQTPAVIADVHASVLQLQHSLLEMDKATNGIQQTFSDDAPLVFELTSTLQEIRRSAKVFRALGETIDEQPEALLRGKHSNDKGD